MSILSKIVIVTVSFAAVASSSLAQDSSGENKSGDGYAIYSLDGDGEHVGIGGDAAKGLYYSNSARLLDAKADNEFSLTTMQVGAWFCIKKTAVDGNWAVKMDKMGNNKWFTIGAKLTPLVGDGSSYTCMNQINDK